MSRKLKVRLTHEDRASIARRYAYEDLCTTMDSLAVQYSCSIKIISGIIHKAIESKFYTEKECILVKEKMYYLTAQRCPNGTTPYSVINAYQRSYQKRKLLDSFKAELAVLEFQLQTFDDWMSSDEEKDIRKQEIENRIYALKRMI